MSLINSLWNSHQQRQIGEASVDASQAKGAADKAHTQLMRLEEKVDRLALASQALWELIRAATKASDDVLKKKMQEIDLRDGVKDGRMSRSARACPSCNRAVSRRHDKCMFCGTEVAKDHVFQE